MHLVELCALYNHSYFSIADINWLSIDRRCQSKGHIDQSPVCANDAPSNDSETARKISGHLISLSKIFSFLYSFAILVIFNGNVHAYETPVTLESDWQYRWGDSPFDQQGIPLWTLEDAEHGNQWLRIKFPSNPPSRNGKTNVWYRITLPDGNWRDPVIYVYSVDLIVQVYLDGKQIYHYGSFGPDGRGRFEGWPWHMMELPKNFNGKLIYFRIFSDYSDIGLWGEIKLMERLDLIRYLFDNSIEQIIVSGLSFLIAILSLAFALLQSERKTFFYLSLFALSSGFVVLGQCQAKQFLFNAPLVWDHLAAAGYFLLPVAMALLFGAWCAGPYHKLVAAIWKFHLAYVATAMGLSLTGNAEIPDMYFIFDGLFAISLIVLFGIAFSRFNTVSIEKKIVIITFVVFSLFLLVDMAVAHSYLPWVRVPMAWGLLAFSLAIIAISLRHFSIMQHELKELNATLEQKIAERTRELEYLASRDPLTGALNRRAFFEKAEPIFRSAKRYRRNLSIIVLDIDHFKQFNDTHGHAVGDEVLILVSNCCQEICRVTDFAARFGGEEFTILLEEADERNAFKIADRLRQTLSELIVPVINQRITASFGISSLSPETKNLNELIIKADKALYRAKQAGRNNCQVG